MIADSPAVPGPNGKLVDRREIAAEPVVFFDAVPRDRLDHDWLIDAFHLVLMRPEDAAAVPAVDKRDEIMNAEDFKLLLLGATEPVPWVADVVFLGWKL